jgi:hypothetical protein
MPAHLYKTRQDTMRLWTLHPRYLDARGLVAVWREALLAQEVLRGATKGYQHHPQLARFRTATDSFAAIASYLRGIFEEAQSRGYAFDVRKIPHLRPSKPMKETRGQLLYEWNHLQLKLKVRDLARYKECRSLAVPASHPLFRIVAGDVQPWERVRHLRATFR